LDEDPSVALVLRSTLGFFVEVVRARLLFRRLRLTAALGVIGTILWAFGAYAPQAMAGSASPCSVKNMATLAVYEGSGSNLQAAIDAARPGVRLRVQGVCVGTFAIGQDLALVGRTSPAYPKPARLDGNSSGTVLSVTTGKVAIRNMTITHGASSANGGGIDNAGALRLRDTVVTANTAVGAGGGISDTGTLILNGSATVSNNTASGVGGIWIDFGTVILNDAAQVIGNAGARGGILNSYGVLTMHDTSSIADNRATSFGGGSTISAVSPSTSRHL